MYTKSILFACILLAGCISNCSSVIVSPEEHVEESLPVALFESLPISVVIYYDDEFLGHYITRKNWWGGFKWHVPVGSLNAGIFNEILPILFEDVVFSNDDPISIIKRSEYDLVIRPKLLKADYKYADEQTEKYTGGYQRSSLLLSYAITFSLPNGQILGSWIIRSYKILPFGVAYKDESITSAIKALYKLNTRGIGAIFISEFCEKEYILNEFYNQCTNHQN